MSQDFYTPPTEAQLRRSLLLEAAAYIEESNLLSPTRASSLVSRLLEEAETRHESVHISERPTERQSRRSLLLTAGKHITEATSISPAWAEILASQLQEEAEADPYHLDISVGYDNPFGASPSDFASIQVRFVQPGSSYENYLDIDQAEMLIRLTSNAVVEARLALAGTEPDPELVALHDPTILQSARAVASFVGREVHIYFPPNGDDPALCPDVPDTDLYLRVEADGSTRLTDERGDR